MGQAPATEQISLRTVPRNFPGRSGTEEDQVYLCSPETAIASAITGKITDPRTLGIPYPHFQSPSFMIINQDIFIPPQEGGGELVMGPNIKPFPTFGEIEDHCHGPVLLKMGDNVSTDEILPAGSKVLPYRSNIPKIAEFSFVRVDATFYNRSQSYRESGFIVIGGKNYGQGSSREHAAIAPRYLGLRAVIAKSFARIHRKNLINFGILPLVFEDPQIYDQIQQGDRLHIDHIRHAIEKNEPLVIRNEERNFSFSVLLKLSDQEQKILLAGGLIDLVRQSHPH
jgi:aconitate hydratase